jgi:hypothetical protein
MSSESTNDTQEIHTWRMEQEDEVPMDVTNVRVHASATFIPCQAFIIREFLRNIELPEGLQSIGEAAFFGCTSLIHCKIPSTVFYIGRAAFKLTGIRSIELPSRLPVIFRDTFEGCDFLTHVDIPSTVRYIKDGAFRDCSSLVSASLPDKLLQIGEGAFTGCSSLTYIKIPKTVTHLDSATFADCSRLISVELHEDIESIAYDVFEDCSCLRNIYTPNVSEKSHIFEDWGCDSLQSQFSDWGDLEHALQNRFSGLPIHRLCYYQGYAPATATLKGLGSSLLFGVERYYPTLEKQDKFGMTPLHILSLSQRQNLQLCKEVVERSRRSLFKRDKWGNTPVEYLFFNPSPGSAAVICYFVGVMLIERLERLGFEPWKIEVQKAIQVLAQDLSEDERMEQVISVHSTLAKYETMEATSLLEMALWKIQITASKSSLVDGSDRPRKKAKRDESDSGDIQLDETELRNCRLHSNSQTIIPKVLSFLWSGGLEVSKGKT